MIRSFVKLIPTDLDWHGTIDGGYCRVTVNDRGPFVGGGFTVAVRGTDDTALVRFFASGADALQLFNDLRYIQSALDLSGFAAEIDGVDNNGWPSARALSAEDVWDEGSFARGGPRTTRTPFDGFDDRNPARRAVPSWDATRV